MFCFASERIACCTIALTDVNELTRPIHYRVPVVPYDADAGLEVERKPGRVTVGCRFAKFARVLIRGAVVAPIRFYRDMIGSRER